MTVAGARALDGIRVIDAATLAAGPMVATALGEFGADVIKVEQPGGGDPLRDWGPQRDGVGLLWKSMARNKRSVTMNLREPGGRDLLRRLVAEADVLVTNLRPSTLSRWGLAYEELRPLNRGLIMLHVTAFGAGGPDSDRPGFGSLGEALSGFAHLTGQADGPPTLPPFMLADGVAGLTATYAVMMALYHRDVRGGAGQLVDVNLIEPLARLIEQPALAYDQLGTVPGRVGNQWDINAPRNTYQAKDGRWLVLSGGVAATAVRALRTVGRADLVDDPRFADARGRLEHAEALNELIADWVAQRTLDDAMAEFRHAGVAAAPVYDVEQLLADPHLTARDAYPTYPDPDLGSMRVPAPVPRLSGTPGHVEHLGPRIGEHTDEVLGGVLGIGHRELTDLRAAGVI